MKEVIEGIDCSWYEDCVYYKQLKRLQEENEKLKEKIESYNCNANCYKYKEANKYKQALEEIRTYVNAQLDGFGNDVYGITKKQIITITNTINEVLNDRD